MTVLQIWGLNRNHQKFYTNRTELTTDSSQLTFVPSSKSHDTETRKNIKIRFKQILDIVS